MTNYAVDYYTTQFLLQDAIKNATTTYPTIVNVGSFGIGLFWALSHN